MKKIISIFILCSIFIFFIINNNEEVIETSLVTDISPSIVSDETLVDQKVSSNQKNIKKSLKVDSNEEEAVKLIKILITNTLKEISDCEEKFDQIITVPIDEISSIDNQALIYIIDDFDEMNVSSASLSKLLVSISENNLNLSEEGPLGEVYQELSLVRPCRPFEKVTFINELVKRSLDPKTDSFFKKRTKDSIKKYLIKELNIPSNLSNINMMANLTNSLFTEGLFDENLKEEASKVLEDLEDSFDDIVDLAEEHLDESEVISNDLVKKELETSERYRIKLLNLINRI